MNARNIKRQFAFTLIELLVIIVIVVMLVVLAFRLPRAKSEAQRKQCVSNLKQVGLAFRQTSLDSYDLMVMHYPSLQGGSLESITNGEVFLTFQAMSNLLRTPNILACPTDN